MMLTAPWLLLALLALPALWFLLRATPPAPRSQNFPAMRLLLGIEQREETPARTPWWLLALRLGACAALILGLAGPVLLGGGLTLAGSPVLIVLDDGFAAAPDFAARQNAAEAVLDRAERANLPAALLTTADSPSGTKPTLIGPAAPRLIRRALEAVSAKPWGTDRPASAAALANFNAGSIFYIADGLASPDDSTFARALRHAGPVTQFDGDTPLLLSAHATPGGLVADLRLVPSEATRLYAVQAQTSDGRVLAQIPLPVRAGAAAASATIPLPPALLRQLTALRLSGLPGAGTIFLLDAAAERRPVGLWTRAAGAETPLLGDFFYIDRALSPTTELRRGDLATLLAQPLSMLVVANGGIEGADAARITAWVKQGGLLLRFAGPSLDNGDALLPAPLLGGDRSLGGAMSWSQPAALAPFPAGSPFAGLVAPHEVTISRQVLDDPASLTQAQNWVTLADGTPLVTQLALGQGEIVFFHVTANADWSNLPLSGLFVDLLNRLVARAQGIRETDAGEKLAALQVLDGQGVLGKPPPFATQITLSALPHLAASPQHPPGFYGASRTRHALNIATALPPLAAEAPIQGATRLALNAAPRTRPLGPWLVALALFLLATDMALTLRLRGLLRPALATLLLLAPMARAQESPALATHLAYVVTGDPTVDAVSKSGLAGLSAYVNDRTAAVLADPLPVIPGQDDLSFYPLLYFPIIAGQTEPPAATAALNDYMRQGGIVLIDLQGAAQNGGGADAALRHLAEGLDLPPLTPLSATHVLAHSFYLLNDFPGRYDGDTVWVQRDQDRSNDSVSPVVIGSNDWAAAWAVDADGQPTYGLIPGGDRQRSLAFRFGVNLVMYALTGNYKGDQVHVPAILERLGQ